MRALVLDALGELRTRRGRAALAAGGVLAASLVLGLVLTAAYSLATGFDRAAERGDLPSILARFHGVDRPALDARIRALPNLKARAYRTEITNVPLQAGEHRIGEGVLHIVGGARRGYAVTAGRDLRPRANEALIEAGLAREWGLGPGDRIGVGRLGFVRVAGVVLSADNVAYPLARTARVYLSRRGLERRFGGELPVNVALLWAADESRTDVLLSQARASAGNVSALRFTTRSGIQALVQQGAGLVVALLVAFALVAAGLAGVLVAAAARSDVQRRLPAMGLRRAVGATRGHVVALHAVAAALVAAPAAAVGLLTGALLGAGPVRGVLDSLNQLPPPAGAQLAAGVGLWIAVVALVTAAAAWPALGASRRPPVSLLRRGDLAPRRARTRPPVSILRRGALAPRGSMSSVGGGLALLGARLVAARRARFAALVVVLAAASAVVLLLLSLASLLVALRDDPATLGKRYQLSARLDADRAAEVRALPGVRAAAPRYEVDAVSATALGSPLRLIAYPGDHTRFEAPALSAGRRIRSDGEAEVGAGLADAVGLGVGSTLAVQPPGALELRFRVVGVVRALQDEGRVAYVRPGRLAAALPSLDGPLAVRLEPGADRTEVQRALTELGAAPRTVGGATADDQGLLDLLARLLRLVALTVALVCLSSLVQALALTAIERRGAVATLRTAGADLPALRRLLAGAALTVVVPAALLAVALEGLVLAPLTERLAAGYADLPLAPRPGQALLVAAGLLLLALTASAWIARRLVSEPTVAGLREAEA